MILVAMLAHGDAGFTSSRTSTAVTNQRNPLEQVGDPRMGVLVLPNIAIGQSPEAVEPFPQWGAIPHFPRIPVCVE